MGQLSPTLIDTMNEINTVIDHKQLLNKRGNGLIHDSNKVSFFDTKTRPIK